MPVSRMTVVTGAALVAVALGHPVAEEVARQRREACDEKQTDNGRDYKGCQTKTQGGSTCLAWNQQKDGKSLHPMFHKKFPDLESEQNYCRNPDGKPSIWCFVDEPKSGKKFDYCVPVGTEVTSSTAAPFVTEEGYVWDQAKTDDDYYGYDDWWNTREAADDTWNQFEYEMDDDKCDETIKDNGHDYRGCQTKTITGRTCQRWTDSVPHEHARMSVKYPGMDLNNHNYCRNPDGENTIWCYTMDPDKRWEFCDTIGDKSGKGEDAQAVHDVKEELDIVKEKLEEAVEEKAALKNEKAELQDENQGLLEENEVLAEVVEEDAEKEFDYGDDAKGYEEWWSKAVVDDDDKTRQAENVVEAGDCEETMTGNGHDYRGCASVTVSGDTCQKWTVQEPQEHQRLLDTFKGMGLNNHNYCRNPDGEDTIWCYTTNPDVRWDYCDPMILAPGEEKHESKQEEDIEAIQEEIEEIEEELLGYQDDAEGYEEWWAARDADDDGKAETLLDESECDETLTGNGHDYRGCADTTVGGVACQKWTSQEPHKQDRFAEKFPGMGLNDHNYCRNPDHEDTIWCYTMDPDIRWDYCAPKTKKAQARDGGGGGGGPSKSSGGGAGKFILIFGVIALAGLAYSNKDAISVKLSEVAGSNNTSFPAGGSGKTTTNPAYTKVAGRGE